MAQRKPARILVVDDQPLIRRGIRHLLEQETDFQVCGEAAGARKSLAAIQRTSPDLVILDVNLKDGGGLGLVEGILRHSPQVRVLVCSVYDELYFAERALRAGARGYVSKFEAPEQLLRAVRKTLAGKVYLSSALTEQLLMQNLAVNHAGHFASPIDQLSDRELQVFELIGAGHSTTDIARKLSLSVKTVETHRARTKAKLNLKTSAELTRYALRWSMQLNHQAPLIDPG